MFAIHTPVKKANGTFTISQTDNTGPKEPETKMDKPESAVRRSIENIEANQEAAQLEIQPSQPSQKRIQAIKLSQKEATRKIDLTTSPPVREKYPTLALEAKACLSKAKTHLANSRNLRTDIKDGVLQAIDRLYQIAKIQDKEIDGLKRQKEERVAGTGEVGSLHPLTPPRPLSNNEQETELVKRMEEQARWIKASNERMEEHSKMFKENNAKMAELKEILQEHKKSLEVATYASVAAVPKKGHTQERKTLHSIVVTSSDETESGEEVLNEIRKVINAKEGGIAIDRVRKGKDRKVIIGCGSEEDRNKVKDKLDKAGGKLKTEEIKNKDPLVILKDVLACNTEEEVLGALRKQNQKIFEGLSEDEDRLEVKYRRKSRNAISNHIVLRVSPRLWNRLTEKETIRIDMQRIQVSDQSPLVQCSQCLGYGHTKRLCKEEKETCSHCAGPHKKAECPEWNAGTTPVCRNCASAKLGKTDHNAFSTECPVRRKWDALARAETAYC